MSSFEFFIFRVAFCFAKIRLFRVPLPLHSFATLRNWLRQPLQSLPLFKIKKLEIEPNNKFATQTFSKIKPRHFSGFILHSFVTVPVCPMFCLLKKNGSDNPKHSSCRIPLLDSSSGGVLRQTLEGHLNRFKSTIL